MNKEIKEAIDEFLIEFKNLPVVKNYLLIKTRIKEDKELLSLKQNLKDSQKALALSIGTSSYQENKEKYEKLKDLYENHPLLINYKVYEEEIHHLLKEIENSLK